MKLVIFGANGPTGRLLTQQALAEGHIVTAVTRHPVLFPLQHDRLQVMLGDVFDPPLVEQAVCGQDAVLSTLGVPYSRQPITLYSQGMAHIIQAIRRCNVRRLICVSSSATDTQTRFHDTGGGFIFEKLMKPFIINVLGRTTYDDMLKMERLVRNSDLDWTIIRPSGLFETPSVTAYQMGESVIGTYTSRTDLADCMLKL
jgi:putative NADH-flavin reductase